MKLFLCILQAMMCCFIAKEIYKVDKPNSVFFVALFAYSIFTEINYALYPDFIYEYVTITQDIWYEFYIFITLSLVSLYFFNYFLIRIKPHFVIQIFDTKSALVRLSNVIILFYSSILIIAIYIIVDNWNFLSYASNILGNYSSQIAFARQLNDWNVYYFLIMITAIKNTRYKDRFKRMMLSISCLLCVIALVLFTLVNGDRSVILLCFVGWFIYYFYDKPLNFQSISKMIPALSIVLIYLFYVRLFRNGIEFQYDYVETILQDDYAFPGLTLLAAINDNFIQPFDVISAFVIKGSIIGSLFGSGDYLYWVLYENEFPMYINQALATGTNPGIGFHLFTEGYIFAGYFGFIYNGIFISILLRFWRHLYTTNDKQTNMVFASIATGIFVIGVRSETAYFIRNFIFYMLPAILLYLLACDKRITVIFKRR